MTGNCPVPGGLSNERKSGSQAVHGLRPFRCLDENGIGETRGAAVKACGSRRRGNGKGEIMEQQNPIILLNLM